MRYNEKLRLYFKEIGISQAEVAKKLGQSHSMMSRYLSGVSVFDANFIEALVREFPDINLKYIFRDEDDFSMASEPSEDYGFKNAVIIEELKLIEKQLANIRKVLAQNRHIK